MFLAFAAPAAHAQAGRIDETKAWSNTDYRDSVPVLFTISGGISLGSYQSGVNWALVRFMRRANDISYGQQMRLARPYFAAMAGASAGNINALLSAVAWCSERPGEAPESSVFWHVWVPTGWEQLFPRKVDRGDPGGGVFDRTYYKTVAIPGLKAAMRRVSYPEQCNVPLGMTMTRVVPTQTAITENVSASTQRYAALLRVRASGMDPRKDSVLFVQPELGLFNRSLGSLASLGVREGDPVADSLVLQTLMASSAFPIAFAGVNLHYTSGDRMSAAVACSAAGNPATCAQRDSADFIDGGLFDNNPLALAHGIFRLKAANTGVHPRILYINPDALRGDLRIARARQEVLAGGSKTGIASFLEVLKGAYPSARQYELQSMARYIADPSVDSGSLPYINTTDRGYPIVSEHLYAFAGFFGRPFREYDFYAGVYDALHFVAHTILCQDDRQMARQRDANPLMMVLPRDTVSRSACVRNESQRLLHDTAFGFSRVARIALAELYAQEYTGPPVPIELNDESQLSPVERSRVLLIRELVRANKREFLEHKGCGGDQIDRILCEDGFGGMIARFATPEVRVAVRRLVEDCEHAASSAVIGPSCPADGTLMRLVDNGARAFASERLNEIFRQIQEDPLQTSGTKHFVGSIEFLHRSTDDEYQPMWLGNPSTVPSYAHPAWNLLPYRVTGLVGAGGVGGIEATYLPSVRVPHAISSLPGLHRLHGVRLIAPLGLARIASDTGTLTGSRHGVFESGLGLSYHYGVPWVHDVSIDWRLLTYARAPRQEMIQQKSWRAMWQLFGGKVALGYGHLPSELSRGTRSKNLFTIGAGDANGMLYYLHRVFGT